MDTNFTPVMSGDRVTCPYCGSNHTELFSLFGQQLLTAQYYCQTCHTPFEHIKDDTVLADQAVSHLASPAAPVQAQQRKEDHS